MHKLFIPTFGFISALAASDAVLASDAPDNDNDGGWNDDDGGWNDGDDDGWNGDDDDGWNGGGGGNDGWSGKKKGVRIRDLQFNDRGTHLVARGEVQGVKKQQNKQIRLLVEARGDATALCINPGGWGKNKTVDADEITLEGQRRLESGGWGKNTLEFRVPTDKPDKKIDGAPDCPNWKWTEKIVEVEFTRVELTVVQGGKKIAELECYFDKPTRDGKVPRNQFDCSER
ncbi:MAG: hypothetical protein H0T76_26640 [Nannocystis sp.]|nr:hypothetical protein [Nannocystis sp.]